MVLYIVHNLQRNKNHSKAKTILKCAAATLSFPNLWNSWMQFHITHRSNLSVLFLALDLCVLCLSLSYRPISPIPLISLIFTFMAHRKFRSFVRLFICIHKFICFNGFIITFFGIIYCFTTTDQMHIGKNGMSFWNTSMKSRSSLGVWVRSLCVFMFVFVLWVHNFIHPKWKFLVAYGYAWCEHRHRIYTIFYIFYWGV